MSIDVTRRWIAIALIASTAWSCGRDAPITVDRSGSSVSHGVIYVGARLRAIGDTYGPIRLRVTFVDGKGEVRDQTEDGLPYCPVRTACWWGASFPLDQFDGSEEIVAADVRVVGNAKRYVGQARVRSVMLERGTDGRLRGTVPGDEGYVYLIGQDRDGVRGGLFTSISYEDARRVPFVAQNVAALGRNGLLRAYFYASEVRRGA